MHRAKWGDRVRVQYILTCLVGQDELLQTDQWTVEFNVGGSNADRFLSLSVIGMTPGERKVIYSSLLDRPPINSDRDTDNRIELLSVLVSVDSSSNANLTLPQFDLGGEGG